MSLHTISEWPCAGRVTAHAVTLSSPSPVLFLTAKAPQGALVTHVSVADSDKQSNTEPSVSNVLQDVHISAQLMEDFLELAKENTDKDLETCGVLGAFLENGTFYVTTLIIPKQDSTSSSCQALNEEDVFAIQNERSLFPMGWIHTHPSQSCFMSSVDLHTHYSYQMMVPEAFAIVLAPTDSSRCATLMQQFCSLSYGIFQLTEPSGMSVLKECQETGFHPHKEPADGSPIYEHCSHVYTNSNLRFEIFDLR
ncbi:AMSH-like ubiquitin thioesterase 2 isoform X3 [Citrus sinensis]|uniref:AMSH-like ubiquitin thioesterase 2 isoform X3 n=1 Tax=Citrus sinensis TaxID=2711 RepID=UPI0003D70639|nr:AMSH-like ubiquitin thioesterase 2 isoform X3 [Citrus sinensis]